MKRHRKRAGPEDRLTTFLYLLMRDYLPLGTVELIFQQHIDPADGTSVYSNGHLARYAEGLAKRLLRTRKKHLTRRPT